jgi:hypothetical protein
VVAYEPSGASGVDFDLYTGDPLNPRSENLSPARRDNTLSASWSDPSARDVLLQVVNTGPVDGVGFVGSIQPPAAISTTAGTHTPTATPGAESGSNAATAVTLGTEAGSQARSRRARPCGTASGTAIPKPTPG